MFSSSPLPVLMFKKIKKKNGFIKLHKKGIMLSCIIKVILVHALAALRYLWNAKVDLEKNSGHKYVVNIFLVPFYRQFWNGYCCAKYQPTNYEYGWC